MSEFGHFFESRFDEVCIFNVQRAGGEISNIQIGIVRWTSPLVTPESFGIKSFAILGIMQLQRVLHRQTAKLAEQIHPPSEAQIVEIWLRSLRDIAQACGHMRVSTSICV